MSPTAGAPRSSAAKAGEATVVIFEFLNFGIFESLNL